jgi:putative transposase
MLTVVDDFSREYVALVVDGLPSGIRVTRELNQLLEMRGTPGMVVSDNGAEFTSRAMLAWQEECGVE